MAKLSTNAKTIEKDDGSKVELITALGKHHSIDKSFEIYLSLYQAITGPEDAQKIFRDFSPTFFDLIVVDECHRGSAAEDSAWREILDYFSAATQIGMTATPKETKYISNINYFGEPTYSYTLKQGIRDGFLAPYNVIKVHLDVDIEGYRPTPGEKDITGAVIPDQHYNQKDFDANLVIDERTKRVARWVSDFLKQSGDRFQSRGTVIAKAHSFRQWPEAISRREGHSGFRAFPDEKREKTPRKGSRGVQFVRGNPRNRHDPRLRRRRLQAARPRARGGEEPCGGPRRHCRRSRRCERGGRREMEGD